MRPTPRGYTLLELTIALGIGVLVISGALALLVAQQRTFQSTSRDRGLQESARVALEQVADHLADAGFGVDPALAFDLGPMTGVRTDRAYASQTFTTTSTTLGGGAACDGVCRDSTTGPDEIVFYARDPAFGPHPLVAAATAGSTSLRLALLPGQSTLDLQPGQVLQIACYTGNMTWAYVTASGAPQLDGDGTAVVPIRNLGGSAFPDQTAFLADGCYQGVASMAGGAVDPATVATAAEVFKVDRYHYFIQSYDRAGAVQPWGTPGTRPYLMLDEGLLDEQGAPVVTVVAPDVEDLQLSYVFPADPATPLVGATPDVAIADDPQGIELAPAAGPPTFSDPPGAASRLDHHPGNIGAVRVGIVVRSAVADLTAPGDTTTIPASGNRPATPGPPGSVRLFLETTVKVPNLSNLAPYYPTYGSAAPAGSRTLNVGGG